MKSEAARRSGTRPNHTVRVTSPCTTRPGPARPPGRAGAGRRIVGPPALRPCVSKGARRMAEGCGLCVCACGRSGVVPLQRSRGIPKGPGAALGFVPRARGMRAPGPGPVRARRAHCTPSVARARTHARTRAHAHARMRTHTLHCDTLQYAHHTHEQIRTHKRAFEHETTHTHTHTHQTHTHNTRTHTITHTHARTHARTRTRTYTYIRTHARTHARTHTRAHTHTHKKLY